MRRVKSIALVVPALVVVGAVALLGGGQAGRAQSQQVAAGSVAHQGAKPPKAAAVASASFVDALAAKRKALDSAAYELTDKLHSNGWSSADGPCDETLFPLGRDDVAIQFIYAGSPYAHVALTQMVGGKPKRIWEADLLPRRKGAPMPKGTLARWLAKQHVQDFGEHGMRLSPKAPKKVRAFFARVVPGYAYYTYVYHFSTDVGCVVLPNGSESAAELIGPDDRNTKAKSVFVTMAEQALLEGKVVQFGGKAPHKSAPAKRPDVTWEKWVDRLADKRWHMVEDYFELSGKRHPNWDPYEFDTATAVFPLGAHDWMIGFAGDKKGRWYVSLNASAGTKLRRVWEAQLLPRSKGSALPTGTLARWLAGDKAGERAPYGFMLAPNAPKASRAFMAKVVPGYVGAYRYFMLRSGVDGWVIHGDGTASARENAGPAWVTTKARSSYMTIAEQELVKKLAAEKRAKSGDFRRGR